jgi:hypothetical protein
MYNNVYSDPFGVTLTIYNQLFNSFLQLVIFFY